MSTLSALCATGTCTCCGRVLRNSIRLAEDLADARADLASLYDAALGEGLEEGMALALMEPLAAGVVAEVNAELHGEHLDCAHPFAMAAFRSRAAMVGQALQFIR